MRKLVSRAALLATALTLFALPVTAAPWCADYCDCDSNCWTQCYDEGGSSACALYICRDYCFNETAADPAAELLRAIMAPAAETPASGEATPAVSTAPACAVAPSR